MDTANLCHRGVAPDDRQTAFIDILEPPRSFPLHALANGRTNIAPLLDSDRVLAGQHCAIRTSKMGQIADQEDLGMPGDGEV